MLLALGTPSFASENQRRAPKLNATAVRGKDECPNGGPDGGFRKCPQNTQCCTCVAEEGWTTGGCVPKNETCCGDGSCPDLPDVKCCPHFFIANGGNGAHWQCYNTSLYKCSKKGSGPHRIGDDEEVDTVGALSLPPSGLGPDLLCN